MEESSQLGRYLLSQRIGCGGMAEVFLAYVLDSDGVQRPVVLKRILPHRADSEHFVQMFLDEARIAARFHHPNLVEIHELTRIEGQYCLVMEYLEGVDLDHLLIAAHKHRRHFDFSLIAHVVAEAAAGLQHAHDLTDDDGHPLNLVHRDVSPSNIVVTWSGAVKVVDFGIAKHRESSTRTQTGVLKGKLSYMSPEQGMGQALDRRSDLFSLGIVLYELLTLERCFKHKVPFETLEAVVLTRYIPARERRPDLPLELERILSRLLAREPDERYSRASEVVQDLQDFLASVGRPRSEEIREVLEALGASPTMEPARVFTATSHSDVEALAPGPLLDEVRPAQVLREEPTSLVRLGVLGRTGDPSQDEETIRIPAPPVHSSEPQHAAPRVATEETAPQRPIVLEPPPVEDEATVRHQVPALEARAAAGEDTIRERPPVSIPAPQSPLHRDAALDGIARPTASRWLVAAAALALASAVAVSAVYWGGRAEPGPALENPTPPAPPAIVSHVDTLEKEPQAAVVMTADAGRVADAAAAPDVSPPRRSPSKSRRPTRPVVDRSPGSRTPATKALAANSPEFRAQLTSEPQVVVFIDGKSAGSTPLSNLDLAPGPHQVSLRNPALGLNRNFTWQIKPGEHASRHETFGKGKVVIRVDPWAEVSLRGKKLGTTPMPPFEVFEGQHVLVLRHPPSGAEKRVKVQVVPGEVAKVDEKL
ncbi:MAG: protein kinase [Pseudomonadota bacterium]